MAYVLDDDLKQSIQDAYRTWLGARNFAPRRGQREMIATIARVLTRADIAEDGPRIAAIEAGTGTGKTAAYCLAAIPIARALDKHLVVATATVALQEQIVLRDLPDLAARSGLTFSYALAKGRQRYVCLKRLDDHLRGDAMAELPMFEDVGNAARLAYQRMLAQFADGRWTGDVDAWADGIDEAAWRAVTTDHRGCANNRCGFFRQCPFFKARAGLDKADVVVANLDLVLADLTLGGGAILSEPEDTIYVLDEAHHLPDKTQQHFSMRLRVKGALGWLDAVNAAVGTLTQRVGRPAELIDAAQTIATSSSALTAPLNDLAQTLGSLDYVRRDDDRQLFRFPLGAVPPLLAELAGSAAVEFAKLTTEIDRVHGLVQDVVDGNRSWPQGHQAEDWLGVIGQHVSRAAAAAALLDNYAAADVSEAGGAQARWISRLTFDSGEDFEMFAAPLEPGALLDAALWSRAYAVVCTSATLTALGSFDRFVDRSGLPAEALTLRIASPFDFGRLATFKVPPMRADPRNADAHTDEVVQLLPDLLAQERSALVLFTSWRQLNAVVRRLPGALADRLKVQGNGSKQALLDAHRAAIDAGQPSYLVGVASFAEGLDLPDDYCRHVVIVKLPFAVPDDPLDQAMSEWLEAAGRNPFFEISLPDASLRLLQACGRLIRHEADHGRITLLDRRIVTARYGKRLLDALPAYRRELS
jgi:ATP-dependent DNA helicase DinG